MKRFIDNYLINWSEQKEFKPLLLRGARQVGKTYAVRQLGKKFESFIELNPEINPKILDLFKADLNPNRILQDISYLINKEIIPGKTLLFFDVVQIEPRIILALRYFYEIIPQLHVIAAGSLLDFAIELIGVPVGRVEFLHMYPVSFLEFINALGEANLIKVIESNSVDNAINDIVHNRLLNLLKEYFAIGGMPEVVKSWINEKNLNKCFNIQVSLINAYRQDFNKYARKSQIKYLDILFDNIPLQLGKKFKYSSISGDYRKRELSPCIDLLSTAGIVHKVYHTDAQGYPLGAQINPDDFKIVFLDIALAQIILGFNRSDWLINNEQEFINKGEIVESFIGQEILAYSNPIAKSQLYYWLRQERTAQAEVDYVTAINSDIVPIEVKSGFGSTLKSLHIFLEKHPKSKYGIRFSTQNYSSYNNIKSFPLYAVAQAMNSQIIKS